jgi:SH3-like domain-containing protein
MAKNTASKRRVGTALLTGACIAVAAGLGWSLFGKPGQSAVNTETGGAETASITTGQPATSVGPSGLPIPRFVSLKAEKVNVRRGPSSDHPVAWVFQRKGLPVEIIAEFENWRRVRDSDGDEGWILQSMLAGKRTAVVAPWRGEKPLALYSDTGGTGAAVANLKAGVMGDIKTCNGQWCEMTVDGYDGYAEQSMLWGVYPGESFN